MDRKTGRMGRATTCPECGHAADRRQFEVVANVPAWVAFKRADNSFHGHLPHEGERRVIQVAWLTSEDEKRRKTKRGKLSRLVKKLFGGLDRSLGARRDRNAAHRD